MRPSSRAAKIFQEASELTGTDRAVYLDQACGCDGALRADVCSLLESHEAAGEFLERLVPASEPLKPSPEQLESYLGARIGRYRLTEMLGEGGMGIVYVAEQETPVRRKVALKIIKPGVDFESVLSRFEAERQILAMMTHPGIAQIYDGGLTDSGRPYFVMELVDGKSITQHCDEHRLSLRARVELMVSACDAVHHAHTKGVIHRDLKPGNLLVTLHGESWIPKVIDFGVAKALVSRDSEGELQSQFFELVGTPRYMSPEQTKDPDQDVDTRSDIYSLGVILYRLLTGVLPKGLSDVASENLPEICQAIRDQNVLPPAQQLRRLDNETSTAVAYERSSSLRELRAELQGELGWITLKALSRERDDRYESAAAMGMDLRRYLHNDFVEACPQTFRYRLKKLTSRNFAPLSAALVIVLTMIAGATFSAVYALRAEEAREDATRAEQVAKKTAQQARLAERQTRQLLYAADMNFAGRCWHDQRLRELRHALQRYSQTSAKESNLRGFEWYLLDKLSSSAEKRIASRNEQACLVKFSPSGRYCVIGWTDGTIELRTGGDLAAITTFRGHGSFVYGCDFHPDEDRLATIADDGTIRIWDFQSREQTLRINAFSGHGHKVAFVNGGKTIVATGESETLRLWDADTGELTGTIKPFNSKGGEDGIHRRMAVSPARDQLVVAGESGAPAVYDMTEREIVCRLHGTDSHNLPRCFSFSPSGTLVAAGMRNQQVWVWNAVTGKRLHEFSGHLDDIATITFHPTAPLIASGDYSGIARIWSLDQSENSKVRKAGRWPGTALLHDDRILSLDFSPDGNRLVTGSRDNSVRELSVLEEPILQNYDVGREDMHQLTFLNDQDCLLIASANGLRIRDVGNGELLQHILFDSLSTYSVVASDNRTAVTGHDDGTLRIWELNDRAVQETSRIVVDEQRGSVFVHAIFSEDVLISGGQESSFQVVSLRQQENCTPFTFPIAEFFALPDATGLLAHHDNVLHVVRPPSVASRYAYRGHRNTVTCVTHSNDGTWFVSGSHDRTIRIWNRESETPKSTISGHEGRITCVMLSPDEQTIVSGDDRGFVHFSHVATGRNMFRLQLSEDQVDVAACSADRRRLAIAQGGQIHVITLDYED